MGTPDKAKAAAEFARWYAEHGAERNAKKRAQRAANPDEVRAKGREYYWRTREVRTAYMREYANARYAKMSRAERFALGADRQIQRYGRSERLDWKHLPSGPCVYCGSEDETVTWDHVIPLSKGGANRAYNCVRSCFKCNNRKRARTPQQWLDPAVAEARRERKRAYIRQWHRDHYTELYAKRKARKEQNGHW